ncbi:hypothetical protein QJS66_21490 [Kocuria rhizophila]|nr:hypothetical protein QJS66_21490 [Kocuria rhizophila]
MYTVDSPDAYDRMVALGVDRITGDFPAQRPATCRDPNRSPTTRVCAWWALPARTGPGAAPPHPRARGPPHLAAPGGRSGYSIRASRGHSMTGGPGVLAPGRKQLHLHTGPGTHGSNTTDQQPDADLPDHVGDSAALWSPRGVLQDTFAR